MDFARKQLENMGWRPGKGLGINEDGITKAIKPNVQLNSRGLGFSVADSIQIKNQWWSDAYNSAAKGDKHDYKITSVGVVVVKPKTMDEKNDKYNSRFKSAGYLERYEDKIAEQQEQEPVEEQCSDDSEKLKKKKKKNKMKNRQDDDDDDDDDDGIERTKIEVLEVEIVDESPKISERAQKKKKKDKKRKLDYDNDEKQITNNDDADVSSNSKKAKNLNHIDFNKIFEMSEGMTCHKAARHGINMTGKMKRLQEQEAEFLRKLKSK